MFLGGTVGGSWNPWKGSQYETIWDKKFSLTIGPHPSGIAIDPDRLHIRISFPIDSTCIMLICQSFQVWQIALESLTYSFCHFVVMLCSCVSHLFCYSDTASVKNQSRVKSFFDDDSLSRVPFVYTVEMLISSHWLAGVWKVEDLVRGLVYRKECRHLWYSHPLRSRRLPSVLCLRRHISRICPRFLR